MTKINKLYDAKKKTKEEDLASGEYVALTGDYWTSVSNNNNLGVTAHHITKTWKLMSFALTLMKTEERHFAELKRSPSQLDFWHLDQDTLGLLILEKLWPIRKSSVILEMPMTPTPVFSQRQYMESIPSDSMLIHKLE